MQTRLALIGTGRWGTKIEATLRTIPEAVLVYTGNKDWRTLLLKSDIDGVVIATPPASHTEIACAFIEHGIPVFIEKPMTLSSADADAIMTASSDKNVPVMVGHIHLYNPAFEAMQEAVPSIGAVTRMEGIESHPGPVRDDYSTLWDSMPHDLSMMLTVMGTPHTVRAEGSEETPIGSSIFGRGYMELAWHNGTTATIKSDWFGPGKTRRMTIIGERGTLVLDDTLSEGKLWKEEPDGTKTLLPYLSERPLSRELHAFIDMCNTKKAPLSGAVLGRDIVRILEASDLSIAQGSTLVPIG